MRRLNANTCVGCSYNLKGLPRKHACPECGHPKPFSRTDIWKFDLLANLAVGLAIVSVFGSSLYLLGAIETPRFSLHWVLGTVLVLSQYVLVFGCQNIWAHRLQTYGVETKLTRTRLAVHCSVLFTLATLTMRTWWW